MRLRIKEWMEMRNVSQAQIAAALSVGRATVNAWVEGKVKPGGGRIMVFPDEESFEALCRFLECTPNDLLELQKRSTPSGLTWRDFRGPRGRGRPPADAEDATATPSPSTRVARGRKGEPGAKPPAAAVAEPVATPAPPTVPTQRQLELPTMAQPAQRDTAAPEPPPAPQPAAGALQEPWVRLAPSPFVPEGKEFGPLFHQGIAMAKGRIVRLDGGRGLLEIDGYRYEFVDKRKKLKSWVPLAKYQEQEIAFSFWPTIEATAIADHAPDDPPIVNLSAMRPSVQDTGLVQVVGLIDAIAPDHVRFAIHAARARIVVYVFMLGRYTGKVGDLVQAFGRLSEGVITLSSWHLLQPEPAPARVGVETAADPNPPPAPLRNAWVRYHPTPFFKDVGQLIALRPMAIGMALGRILEVPTHDGPGVVEIDGHQYRYFDKRPLQNKEKFPPGAMLGQQIMFSFTVGYSSRDDGNRSVKPDIRLYNLRMNLQDPGGIQVIGQVESIEEDRVRFVVHHENGYGYASMRGRYTGEVGDPVQVLGRLVDGEMRMERWHVLKIEPPPPSIDSR